MNPEEFHALAKVERDHWFYRGKRDIVRHWIGRLASLTPKDFLVDVGAGTGQLVAELHSSCRAIGVEEHATGLDIAAGRSVRLVCASILALPLASDSAAIVTALDVIEHVDNEQQAMSELVRVTRPGGLILILVPAFRMLWSDWDDALGHRRRYTRRQLLDVVGALDLDVRHCAYVNSAVFLPILVYRFLRTKVLPASAGRLEDRVPSAFLNRILRSLFVAPACWPWFSPPFGVSVFCILQKRPQS